MKFIIFSFSSVLLLLNCFTTAGAAVFIQNYTNSGLTAQYIYCSNYQTQCTGTYTSGRIAENTAYAIPVLPNYPQVIVTVANTDDGWVFTNKDALPACGGQTVISTVQFANFSKTLLPKVLQCANTIGTKSRSYQ